MIITRHGIEQFIENLFITSEIQGSNIKEVKYKFSKSLTKKSRKPSIINIKIKLND